MQFIQIKTSIAFSKYLKMILYTQEKNVSFKVLYAGALRMLSSAKINYLLCQLSIKHNHQVVMQVIL